MNPIQKIKRRILIRRVNKALGIKLYDWQIERIFNDGATPVGGRCVGVTTANVLRLLLNPKINRADLFAPPLGYPVASSQYFTTCARVAYIFGEDGVSPARRHNFIAILRETRRALNLAGIKTNSLFIRLY